MSKKILAIALGIVTLLSVGCGDKKAVMEMNTIPLQKDLNKLPYKNLKEEWQQVTLEDYVIRMAQQIKETWSKADEVWKNVNYSTYNVLVTDTIGQEAWLISHTGEVVKLNAQELPKPYKVAGNDFSFLASSHFLNDKPTIKVEVNANRFKETYEDGEFEALPNSSQLFAFVTHEEFQHFQDIWKTHTTNQEKLMKIGKDNFEARAMRLEIINHLNQAVVDSKKQDQHLAAAKWWWENYKQNFSNKYKLVQPMDVLEGSARYFDMAMNVRSVLGMERTSDDIQEAYANLIQKDYALVESRYYGYPDEESYDIGGAAGVLLERENKEGWQQAVMNGEEPLEFLLKNVEGIPQEPSKEVTELIEKIKLKRDNISE